MNIERVLEGERICIREYRRSDLSFIKELWFDPETGRYMSDPTADRVDETYQRALDGMGDCADGDYLIVLRKHSDVRIGTACVFADEDGKTYDIGYCICKEWRRQGIGSEVVRRLIDWIRERGGERVTAEAAMENAASNALLRKLGFAPVRESEFRKWNTDIRWKSWIYEKKL